MTIKTTNYRLEAFKWGETYSARVDRRRFTIIDNQLDFISRIIDSGVIFGWDIEYLGNGWISVSSGMGMVDINVYDTLGDCKYELSSNSVHYLYMRAKVGSLSDISSHSEIVSIKGSDSEAPDPPNEITQVYDIEEYILSDEYFNKDDLRFYLRNSLGIKSDSDIIFYPYKNICFYWDKNDEVDFDFFRIEVYEGSSLIKTIDTDYNVFALNNLIQDTDYEIRIYSIDLSGNISDPLVTSAFTNIDTRVPLPPLMVQSFTRDDSVQVIWQNSPSDNIDYYKVSLQLLDENYNPSGSVVTNNVNYDANDTINSTYTFFSNLIPNRYYDIYVYSVSYAGESYISDNKKVRFISESINDAGDIYLFNASFIESNFEDVGLETVLEWSFKYDNPYLEYPNKFIVSFVENGKRFSENIEILEEASRETDCDEDFCYKKTIGYIPYEINGELVYESIKEYMPYFIIIKAVDSLGNVSSGYVFRVSRTPVLDKVDSVSNFSYEKSSDNSIVMVWDNSGENYFSYNKINITINDLFSTDSEYYVSDLNIGKSETYIIPKDKFSSSYRYDISFTSYNVFNDEGNSFSTSFIIENSLENEINSLSPPAGIEYQSGDRRVYLSWTVDYENPENIYVYRIYRAPYSYFVSFSGYELLNSVPYLNGEYIDYDVNNFNSYMYFIVAEDYFGNLSSELNENNSSFINDYIYATPSPKSGLSAPSNLEVRYSSNLKDAEILWDNDGEGFDGYEILRSDGNNYSFDIVGYAESGESNFIDQDALLKDGEDYFYMIRKYKNGSKLVVTSSYSDMENSVFIGKVTSYNGVDNVEIDLSNVINLKDYVDPITIKTNAALDLHHHNFSDFVDRRIDLSEDIVITGWETSDYQIFYNDKLESADVYYLSVNGDISDLYFENKSLSKIQANNNQSPVSYDIDFENKKITFSEKLYDFGSTRFPYVSVPELSLTLVGVRQVDNLLDGNKVIDIYSNQFSSGVIDSGNIPSLSHEGRRGESLNPVKLPMTSSGNYLYELEFSYSDNDRNGLGTAITFYDILEVEEDVLIAATSNGLYYSSSFGNGWEYLFSFDTAVHKLFKSSSGKIYAITSYNVYFSDGSSYRQWTKMSGLDSVRCIRDIAEDSLGNIFISTNLGCFKLNSEFVPYIEDSWEQLVIFGPRSSEAFAIVFDNLYSESSSGEEGRILVSNELGLLQSVNQGASWEYISELQNSEVIWSFYIYGEYIFAVSDKCVYRKGISDSSFECIFEGSFDKIRKILVFNDNIYISTSEGIKVSSSNDIFSDSEVSFVGTLSQFSKNGTPLIATSIDVIGDKLFIGGDRLLHLMSKNGDSWMQFGNTNTVIPTVYIDNEEQKLGFFYNNSVNGSNVFFDYMVSVEKRVFVSNKYDIYIADNGGWIRDNFSADFKVYKNGLLFGESPSNKVFDISPFNSLSIPEYGEINSNISTASEYEAVLLSNNELLTNSNGEGENIVSLVSNFYNSLDNFLSQVYNEVRKTFSFPSINFDIVNKVKSTSNSGELEYIDVPVYNEEILRDNVEYSAHANTQNGLFYFDIPFDKYDNITFDLNDVLLKNVGEYTHREVEDVFEGIYSGPPSYLSQVLQSNIVKFGIYNEENWPNEQGDISPFMQMSISLFGDNFYDTLNSTINYIEEISSEKPFSYISYPFSVYYSDSLETIFVGGDYGALSIDKNTFSISFVEEIGVQKVYNIYGNNDIIYVVAENNIYYMRDTSSGFSVLNRSGLPKNIYCMGFINNNMIVGGDDGLYIKSLSNDDIDWDKVIDSQSPVKIINSSNIIIVVIDGVIYLSKNGFVYTSTGLGEELDVVDIDKYNAVITYISTISGLYSDNGSFNGNNFELFNIDIGSILSEGDTINNCVSDGVGKVSFAASNGKYGVFENNDYKIKNSYLDSIHKIIFVDGNEWIFSFDMLFVPHLGIYLKLSDGLFF